MRPSLTLAAGVAGLAATVTLACSTASDPSADASLPSQALAAAPTVTPQHSGTTNRLQAVSPVNANVVWASGVGGTFAVTTNGGSTWRSGVVAGARELEFRDIEGVSANTAYLMSAGTGDASRIYKTTDGGETWRLQFRNQRPAAFYDCFDFWDSERGLAFSDPVNRRFPVLKTSDGRKWFDIGDNLPRALEGEFGFAASGTCVATQGVDRAWIVTGGSTRARVLATTDRGNTWRAFNTPLVSNPSAGAFTVEFRNQDHGIVAGGDLDPENPRPRNRIAISADGGHTWDLVEPPPFDGAVFGLSYVPGRGHTVVITGPAGAAWSGNEGENGWNRLPGVENFWAVAFANANVGWLVGTEGRILKVRF
ncbi:MAG TPA: hypothetical protein VFH24_03575 [Gemmatimonadales bacterium]|nr:hypothetical protein [Gemmatimonadales bacterium]